VSGGLLEALGALRELQEEKQKNLHAICKELATSPKKCTIYTRIMQCPTILYRFLQGYISKVAILDESDEGTMHDLRKIEAAGRCGTEGNLGRQNEYSIHIEVRTLYARRMFREQ